MEIRHLRSFCVVAEEGHVTRAARRLNIAQPGLTQQIRALEEELGVQLFTRVGRGVQITPAGRYLLKEAHGILETVRNVGQRTREIGGAARRTIVVGLSNVETLSETVTAVLKRYRHSHPDTFVREFRVEAVDVAQALRDGRIDAAFSCAAVPDRHDLIRTKLPVGRAVVAIPADHPLAAEIAIDLKKLADEPLILISHGETSGSFEVQLRKACSDNGFAPRILDITPDLLIALNLVASGAGIALMPTFVTGLRSDAITYIPLFATPELHVEFALYTRREESAADVLSLKDSLVTQEL